jgi:hypothetical protein
MSRFSNTLCSALLVVAASPLGAQAAPKILQINWETEKPGKGAAHEMHEKGWPAAMAAAGSPTHYIALTAMTGTAEALYISGYESYAQMEAGQKANAAIPGLSAHLSKLAEKDGDFLSNYRALIAEGIDSLSIGTAPDWPKVRGYRISMVRVRIGHAADYERLRRIQRAAADKAGMDMHVGIYRVTQGVSVPTFMIFRPFNSLAELDAWPAMGAKAAAATSREDGAEVAKLQEFITATDQNIFMISAAQSYPMPEMAKAAPDFWKGHPVLAPKAAAKPAAKK